MKNLAAFFLILLCVPFSLHAQWSNTPIGGSSSGMGGVSINVQDVWSVNNNQGALGFYDHMSAGIYYENRFGLKELSLKSVVFTLPTSSGNFGVSVNHFGNTNYSELKFGLAYGKSFGEHFAAGVQLDYLSTQITAEYGNSGVVTFEIGMMAEIIEDLFVAGHVFNPIQVSLADYNEEKIPSIFKLGLAYKYSEKLFTSFEIEKNINHNPVFHAGMEYQIIEQLYIRTGIATNPGRYSLGFGLKLNKFRLDIASTYHQTLGLTPLAAIIYQFSE
jgi:hypothetical protein